MSITKILFGLIFIACFIDTRLLALCALTCTRPTPFLEGYVHYSNINLTGISNLAFIIHV